MFPGDGKSNPSQRSATGCVRLIEPVRGTTQHFIQAVRLAAGSARMSRGSYTVQSVPTHLGVMYLT